MCDRDGRKLVVAEVDHQLLEIGDVEGAGDLLRGQAVVEVRGQPGGKRYAGQQAKDQIDGVSPNHDKANCAEQVEIPGPEGWVAGGSSEVVAPRESVIGSLCSLSHALRELRSDQER